MPAAAHLRAGHDLGRACRVSSTGEAFAQGAALTITKSFNPSTGAVGGDSILTITVTNPFSVVGATVYEWSKTSGWRLLHASEPPQEQTEHVEPNWLVGCLQNGRLHDAGLRWFVTEGPTESMRIIAYTNQR